MKHDEGIQSGWEDAADNLHERDGKYGTSELRVQAVVQLYTDNDSAAPSPTTFGEYMECLVIVPRVWQMPQATSRPGSSYITQSSVKPQVGNKHIWSSAIRRALSVTFAECEPC